MVAPWLCSTSTCDVNATQVQVLFPLHSPSLLISFSTFYHHTPPNQTHSSLFNPTFFFFCCCQIIVDVSDMVSKATVVKTGRQAGAHSVAEWKKGGERDEATHSGRCTTSSPALTAVTVKTFSLCLLCLGVTRGDNMEERGKGHRNHEANEWRREEEGWGVRWGDRRWKLSPSFSYLSPDFASHFLCASLPLSPHLCVALFLALLCLIQPSRWVLRVPRGQRLWHTCM